MASAEAIDDAFRKYVGLATSDPELELELRIDLPLSADMFTALVKHLRTGVGPPFETVQLDLPYKKSRLEYVGVDAVRSVLSPTDKRPVRPSRAIVKRRDRARLDHPVLPVSIHLNRETPDATASATTTPDVSAFRLKRRASFLVGSHVRVDCTVVQQRARGSDPTPFLPFSFEVEVELVDVGGVGDPGTLVRELCAVAEQCICVMVGSTARVSRAGITEALQTYQRISRARNVRRLIGPQPVTLMRKHVLAPDATRPDPGTVNVWDGTYCVTDKADGVRCQLFCAEGCAYVIDGTMTIRHVADDVDPQVRKSHRMTRMECADRADRVNL